ncbi:MAG: hypothetical protein ACFWUJ_13015 [Pseudomonas fragi]|jgi:uncharacterized coiled-coil protein SlyX
MSRFCFCNCPAGFSAEPERHAPDCPGRSGAGKARTPVPATTPALKVTAAEELDAVLHWRGKHAIAVREREGLQVSLNTADQTIDDLSAAVSRRTKRVRELESQLAYAVDALNEVVKASAMYEKPFEIATLAIGEISALKTADGSKPSTCTWSEGGFSWHTGCGKEWQFTDGGLPDENGMHFCHSCGKALVVESAESA